MAILEIWEKRVVEEQDYDINFAPWLKGLTDTIAEYEVIVPEGLTKLSSSVSGPRVKVWVKGGTVGTRYKITYRITTVGGRIHEDDIAIDII